jgi:2,4-dienoyl-CoA reductase-like NADH-dependent reductase (Old Yellow Enzyme family)
MCEGNNPTEKLLAYHHSVAAGGIGMTTLAYASVTRDGLSFPHQLWLRKDVIPGIRKITDAIHAEGAAASIQIGHCGNMSKKSITGGKPITSSGGLNIYSPTWARSMDKNDIQRVAQAFGDAVNIARESGFNAVEVHAGHGYLISQFLSSYTNHRKDEFGGSLENRMRFMKMVIEKVLEAAKNDIGVIVKINMRDGFKGGMEINESLEVARTLEQMGVHAIVLSGGFVSKAPMYVMRGAMPIRTLTHYMESFWLKHGVRLVGHWMIKTVPFTEVYFFEDALKFRKELKLPLIYVGGILSREKIDMVLDAGFEFVSMARALLNEPDFVNRLKTEEQARSGCEHSNYCIARMYSKEMACYQHINDLPKPLIKELNHIIENQHSLT